MIIHAPYGTKRTNILVQKYLELLNNGVSADEILVLVQNGRKKKSFVEKIKQNSAPGSIGNLNVFSFFGLARNCILKNWPLAENIIKNPDAPVFANLCGLEVSQYIFKNSIKEIEFKGYNSKINLLHQLFRRYSLIVQNSLSNEEVKIREKILNESYADEVRNAIKLYKLQTLNLRAFDYLRQAAIFKYLYKIVKNPFKYVFVDDADEITPACFEYLKYIKPTVSEFFIAQDVFGSSRLGYLSAVNINFEKFLNQKAHKLPVDNKEAITLFNNVKNKVPTELKNAQNESFIRRDEMLNKTVLSIDSLLKNGAKPNEIAIATPLTDNFLMHTAKKLGRNIFFLSGSEKLNQNPTVGTVIELLRIINSAADTYLSAFILKSIVLGLLKLNENETVELVQKYKQANYEYKTGILKFLSSYQNDKVKDFLELASKIKDKPLSAQLYEICIKYINQDVENQNAILKLNKFAKQINDFEEVFKNGFSKIQLIEQLENTIISENPLSEDEIPKDAIVVSTPQKLIDSGIKVKHLFLLDTSNSDWIKQDIGMLYNSWVFQKYWQKDSFDLNDNLELTLDRTARILYKLCLLTDEIYIYSSIYDALGAENFGAVDKFFKNAGTKAHTRPKKIIPRDDQKDVLEYNSGKMAVSAVAGSGKTTIMLTLILKLLEGKIIKDIKSENIFVLTFMESAARNFRERIKQNFPDMTELPQISTIHGLALRILKENNNYTFIGLDSDFEIMDEAKRYEILSKIIAESGLEHDKTELYDRAISDFKNEQNQNILNVKSPSFKIIYKKYCEELKENNLADYDDLLLYALKLLKTNKSVRQYYQNLAQIVIEDEAQDSSALQQELIAILGAKHGNIIRCGDVNQAITATFSNSDTEGFKRFIKTNKNVKMDCSQRCAEQIIDFANKTIDFSKNISQDAFLDIKMRPVEGKNSKNQNAVLLKTFDKEIDEKNFTVQEIKNIRQNNPNASIGILLRSNFIIRGWADFIERHDIKTIKNTGCYNANPVFRTVLAILNFIDNPFDKKTVLTSIQTLLELPKYRDELSAANYASQNNFLDKDGAKYQIWWDLKYFLLKNLLTPQELVLEIGDYYFENTAQSANCAMVYSIVEKLMHTHKTFEATLLRLNEISNKINKSTKFFADETQDFSGAVNLMTIHKAKGDEFDYVFVPELSSDNMGLKIDDIKLKKNTLFLQNIKNPPKPQDKIKHEILNENYRLLYVAITRAKEKLYLTCAKNYKFYKKDKAVHPCEIFKIREGLI